VTRVAGLVAIGWLAWAAGAAGESASRYPGVQVATDPAVVADFTLTDQDGKSFRLADLRGRNVLVFFGFTHCPSICPTTMFKLKSVAGKFTDQDAGAGPAVVFISVDGDRDSPEVMKRYLEKYPPAFTGLTGNPKEVRKIAAGFKAVFFKGLPYDDAGNYQVEHTSFVYLLDGEGRMRATFLDAPVEAMTSTVQQLAASPK
jgi:protein SCO1/2